MADPLESHPLAGIHLTACYYDCREDGCNALEKEEMKESCRAVEKVGLVECYNPQGCVGETCAFASDGRQWCSGRLNAYQEIRPKSEAERILDCIILDDAAPRLVASSLDVEKLSGCICTGAWHFSNEVAPGNQFCRYARTEPENCFFCYQNCTNVTDTVACSPDHVCTGFISEDGSFGKTCSGPGDWDWLQQSLNSSEKTRTYRQIRTLNLFGRFIGTVDGCFVDCVGSLCNKWNQDFVFQKCGSIFIIFSTLISPEEKSIFVCSPTKQLLSDGHIWHITFSDAGMTSDYQC